ncbi:response regulator receiver domain protein (CheY-like) [Sulfurimonas denitrificans DSM 1251]|uniref:Response regulator receiver domain protein (CheY-like) n=1 Tax=Sulfurimonas denitrificans (strain ATCC 33889 / DSM 1251) TaxID=326298 RepID=Q30SF6_SULDN|nr:response regulator [Sulfurimonas denitrificans]ABB44075.1 response regulator receiver domain protein (CheY-like) [Sulfurimonas denitrificans DSM 1251]
MQNFLSENYIEIVVFILFLGLSIIYLILRVKKNKQNKETTNIIREEIEKKVDVKPMLSRKKRELIKHQKITRDDFSIFTGVKILIAEDNIINQKVIIGLLSTSGIDIKVANDGQETLDMLEINSDFSIIFMDVHMPILDGFQATKLIRKNPKYEHIPIIALSGDTDAADIKNMLDVGMDAHVEKPLNIDALYDILYIYTTAQESKNTILYKNNEALKEFDIALGLEICSGDKEFYIEILHDFISTYSNSAMLIQELISNSNGSNAKKILLDISGVAANIGASKLHEIAIELKDSISNPANLEYITKLKKYKRSLQHTCKAINEYIKQN